jgi:hypothetical protein
VAPAHKLPGEEREASPVVTDSGRDLHDAKKITVADRRARFFVTRIRIHRAEG